MKNPLNRTIITLVMSLCAQMANAEAIKIAVSDSPGQKVGAEVVARLFEMVGEDVEFVQIDDGAKLESLCSNQIDIAHMISHSELGYQLEKLADKGCIVELATHEARTRQGWWYPLFVKQHCAGLPDWNALNACAEKFAHSDTGNVGVFIGGPLEWQKRDIERVAALKMNFVVKEVDSREAIQAELERGIQSNLPVVIFNQTPGITNIQYPGEFVEFPEFDVRCIDDPSWGSNPEMRYDCDNPTDALGIVSARNFILNHSIATVVAKNVSFSNMDIENQISYVVSDGMEVADAAIKWLDEHKEKWETWLQ